MERTEPTAPARGPLVDGVGTADGPTTRRQLPRRERGGQIPGSVGGGRYTIYTIRGLGADGPDHGSGLSET
jgi:hypothetical protein